MPRRKAKSRTQSDLEKEFVPTDELVFCKIDIPGEGTYKGYMRNGKREGHGILVEKNGFVSYEGYWENDQPSGYGVRKYSKTGDRHEGDYVAGKREGCGVYLWANGDKYKGDWKQGLMDGHGRFDWQNNDVYIGDWREGKIHGEGYKVHSGGSKIEGQFENGMLHGWGKASYPEGDRYNGEYNHDVRVGYGEYSWVDGSYYSGMWDGDVFRGVGVMHVPENVAKSNHSLSNSNLVLATDNIVIYRGDLEGGERNGFGVSRNLDSDEYSGQWKNGLMHGWGSLRYKDKFIYTGDFENGLRHGQGQLEYNVANDSFTQNTTNDMEADDFINNQTPVEPVEEAIQEQFDFLLDGPMHTVQDMLYTWGGVYIGSWHEDNPDGVGVLSLANGQTYTGIFEKGKIRKADENNTNNNFH